MSKPGSSNENLNYESQQQIAQKNWEIANNVEVVSSVDEIYRYDKKQQQDILAAKPWDKE